MIFGECPYCNEPVANHLYRGNLPCFERIQCPSCTGFYWLWHSRIDPKAYTEEAFQAEYEIRENKTVWRRVKGGDAL